MAMGTIGEAKCIKFAQNKLILALNLRAISRGVVLRRRELYPHVARGTKLQCDFSLIEEHAG